jgi:hypothetical protein
MQNSSEEHVSILTPLLEIAAKVGMPHPPVKGKKRIQHGL